MNTLEIAKEAAAKGGEIVRRYYHDGVTMRSKESYNLVSDADVESEQAIVALIREAFPDHQILAEEGHHESAQDAEHLWVIDPLDGTNNFAHQISHFSVSIGYYHQGVAQCAVVYNPITEEWHTATRGGGAFLNDAPISVSPATELTEALVGVGFFYDRGDMMERTLTAISELFRAEIHGLRRFGAASLDLCQVATGRFGAYFEYELCAWDFGAGRLILEEAGGKVTTCRGEPLPLRSGSVLSSNSTLHDAMLAIVGKHVGNN